MTEELPIIDTSSIEEVKETMGDKLPRMFNYFFEDSQSYFNSIENGFNTSNIDEIINSAHSLKSSSKLIGALQLSKKAEYIESAGRRAKTESSEESFILKVENDIQIIRNILDITHKQYKKYQKENNI